MTKRPDSDSKTLQSSGAQNSALDTLRTLRVNDIEYDYHSLGARPDIG